LKIVQKDLIHELAYPTTKIVPLVPSFFLNLGPVFFIPSTTLCAEEEGFVFWMKEIQS